MDTWRSTETGAGTESILIESTNPLSDTRWWARRARMRRSATHWPSWRSVPATISRLGRWSVDWLLGYFPQLIVCLVICSFSSFGLGTSGTCTLTHVHMHAHVRTHIHTHARTPLGEVDGLPHSCHSHRRNFPRSPSHHIRMCVHRRASVCLRNLAADSGIESGRICTMPRPF